MITTIVLSSLVLLASSSFAVAQNVSVCSKFHSSKCISAPTKAAPLGKKVRLPGGTWIDCEGDCEERLRIKTIDFWQEQMLRN